MKNANKIMKKILGLVKDEHKEMIEAKVKKATEEFVALSEDEQEDWFFGDGTIGYFFDDNHLELDDDWYNVLVKPDDETDFVEFVCDYLDCFLD